MNNYKRLNVYSQNDFEQNKKSLQNLYLKMKKRMEK